MRSSAWLLGGLVGRLVVPVAVVATLVAAPSGVSGASGSGVINAVGAENEYANVIGQIGGRYVHVSAVMSNPNTDPHTFEASTGVAREIAGAQLIVQNGVGYDTFMSQLESASPSRGRKVIDVQELLGLPLDTANPHLWYKPSTMPAVARQVEHDLIALDPHRRAYFSGRLAAFTRSLAPVTSAIAAFRAKYAGDTVATTEPVADYLLSALGLRQPHAVSFPGGHNERRRPLARGHRLPAGPVHQAPGRGCSATTRRSRAR